MNIFFFIIYLELGVYLVEYMSFIAGVLFLSGFNSGINYGTIHDFWLLISKGSIGNCLFY